MKKSVRIRKALPGETPGYYNKTAKFLKKAQMGMQVGSPSMDPQRLNTIYTNVYASLKADITPDVIYSSLISEYALDEQTALALLRSALERFSEEGGMDPATLEGGNQQQNQQQEAQPSETQDRESQEQYDQRMSDDAEQDELAMSDEGYYDGEEAANNDTSHLDTEEEQQQQAFAFGGYYDNGGESEDYSDYYDDSNQYSSPENTIINQYNNPGQNTMEKPFSMEDLISITPGIQGNQAMPGIEDYLGDYRPVSEAYDSMDYLPRAQNGLIAKATAMAQELAKGYGAVRKLVPMSNMSGIRNLVPAATLTGQALTKLPWVGSKLTPQLKTTFTQNRDHLWDVLHGADPNKDIFGKVGTVANPDGSLQVNRLLLYQDDISKILTTLESGADSKVFKLGDIQPMAQSDGLVSGIYPMDAKITGGVDDAGHKFFEISHTFGPNQTLPFGSTSNKAKEIKFKNRFYYNSQVDDATGETGYQVFGPLGETLTAGTQTKYKVNRPFVPSVLKTEAETLLRDPNTPFPNFTTDFGRNPNGPFTSGVGRTDITATPPSTLDRLSTRGKIGRGIENFTLGTWVPQTFGLGNPLRTSAQNVETLNLPVLGYSSSALGPNVINPAGETGVYDDIRNAMNYKYRIGRNALIGAGGLGYLGYKTWDAFNPCQCDDPTANNYMPRDKYDNCPCGGNVGERRTLDPTGVQTEEVAPKNELNVPDSMKFLIEEGLYPTEENYYRLKGKNKRNQAVDYKHGGQIPRYQAGGAQRALEGLRRAEEMFANYRRGDYWNAMPPRDLKQMSRNIADLPEFIRNEQRAQQAIYHWPSHSEIADMLDIQRNILAGNYSGGNIPTPLWRRNAAANTIARATGRPSQQSQYSSLLSTLGLQNPGTTPSPLVVPTQSQIIQPPRLISRMPYDDFIGLSGEELQQLPGNIQFPFSVDSDSGQWTLHKHPVGDKYYFYANMTNPIQSGRTFKRIMSSAFPNPYPEIEEPMSLSLDSWNLLVNTGYKKDWTLRPIGHIKANDMAVHHPLSKRFQFHQKFTPDEIEDARRMLDKMIVEKGLIDDFGDQVKMNITPSYDFDRNHLRNRYNFQFPNFNLKRNYRQGGVTQNQFVKAFTSKFQDGGPKDQSFGQGKRMDTLTNDVESRKNIFKSKLKDNSNVALTKEIYKNAQGNPQILNMLMQDGPKENLAENTEMQTAQFGGIPSWYTGYNTALSPRDYKKLYRQVKRMMSRGLDISRANMASNFYDKRFMQPGFGAVTSVPDYMNMLAMSSLPMYRSAANVYGAGRKPSQAQADEATIINNTNGMPLLPEMTPDFIDSPLMGGSGGQYIAGSDDLLTYDQGGFVDMDAENPLVKFIYGGNDAEYYEPDDLPIAQKGINILNQEGEHRVVGDKLDFDEWAAGEKEDWETANPGGDFDAWKNDPKRQQDYDNYGKFYDESLTDYLDYEGDEDTPETNTCPPGYEYNGTECVKKVNKPKCGPGTVWNATYNTCIPVANINYNPKVVRGQSGLFRNLAPWNPAIGYAGSWTKQKTLPYYLGSNNPYMGQLSGDPAARYVTKKGIFGAPKKWIDIYDVDGTGQAINPMEIEQLVNQQGNGTMRGSNKPNRRDLFEQVAKNKYGFTENQWQNERGASRRDMIRDVRQDMRTDRRGDGERMFPRMRAIGADRNPTGRGRQVFKNAMSRIIPFGGLLQPKGEYGGSLKQYYPGGANDGGYIPYALGTGFGMGVGQSTSGYDQHSADAQFQRELQGGNSLSKVPAQQQNPFAFVTGTGTGSYTETANTGHTLGSQGQEIIPQGEPAEPAPDGKRNLVGVENKRKDMWNVDPESGVNQFNAYARGALNFFDPEKKRQCGPGTTWNSDKQMCQPTDSMDVYAAATEQDRGDWQDFGSKLGMYRYDQEGQDRSSRATFGQYGGYMQQGGFYDPYSEDEEVYMTPEELEQFLAAGGQVEYL